MNAHTPSDAAILTLLRGDPLEASSGKGGVQKLGTPARRLLRALWSSRADLTLRKPVDQVAVVRALYADVPSPAQEVPAPPAPNTSGTRPRWRLHHLRCRSIRGVAPFGEEFEFAFDGDSVLIYGPNGTGKSSLVNAIAWVFTGKVSTDCDSESEVVTLYAPAKGSGRPTKLCDWPVVNTIPHGSDPKKSHPNCAAEVTLKSADGSRTLHLRRTPSSLDTSSDGAIWQPCPDLSAHGITPLDIQLSISAATVFGRRSLESSPDTRHLLSMMLGYDALEELGGLVTGMAAALTKVFKSESEAVQERKTRLRAHLSGLSGAIREGHPVRVALTALTGEASLTSDLIRGAHAAAVTAVELAEADLADVLGLRVSDRSSVAGLGDAATAALSALDKPWAELFPALGVFATAGIEDPDGATSASPDRIATRLEALETAARHRIEARLAWWRQEVVPGSRATLLIQAAAYYVPDTHTCPVCEQSVRGVPVEARLAELKGSSAELRAELRIFFRDLTDEVERIVPQSIRSLADADPAALVRAGWARLKAAHAPPLASLAARYDSVIADLANFTVPVPDRVESLFPAGAEDAFREAGAVLATVIRLSWRGLAVASWAAERFVPLIGQLTAALTSPDAIPPSLYAVLAKGGLAAADAAPLCAARDALAAAAHEADAIAVADGAVAAVEEIRTAIEEIKNVGKFAEAEVEHVFGRIRDATIDRYGKMYPHSNPDLRFVRLHVNKGRDKTVEAYLATDSFELPGHQVANAGCIRAVALAFYFALLEKHPGGLGFVVMDDPILSLDENHREAWSANVLRPCLSSTQVILATHQRQFLNNCRSDFHPGRLVELNPRTRSRRITWRPGDRLANAERMVEVDWNSAPVELRKYREELLITLDTYSPVSFFMQRQLKDSLERYAAFSPPHPLSGANAKIAGRLRDEKVARVLDPGSHAMTEADVTEPMVRVCLGELLEVDVLLRKELDRLEDLRLRELRSKSIPARPALDAIVETPPAHPAIIPAELLRIGEDAAAWRDDQALKIIGMAAAQTRGCVVDMAELPRDARFPPGGAVLVAADGLAPLARSGQWVLLADPSVRVGDGDYAAVIDQGGNHFLRRVWSAGDVWLFEAINPLAHLPPIRVRKCACAVRKIVGVIYEPARSPRFGTTRLTKEWHPRQDFPAGLLGGRFGVLVRGTSLAPLVGDGHTVVVGQKIDTRFESVGKGSLAVVETDDSNVGNVIKRVYPGERSWQLLSPNPIDPRSPLVVPNKSLRAVWPVHGVLFDLTVEGD